MLTTYSISTTPHRSHTEMEHLRQHQLHALLQLRALTRMLQQPMETLAYAIDTLPNYAGVMEDLVNQLLSLHDQSEPQGVIPASALKSSEASPEAREEQEMTKVSPNAE